MRAGYRDEGEETGLPCGRPEPDATIESAVERLVKNECIAQHCAAYSDTRMRDALHARVAAHIELGSAREEAIALSVAALEREAAVRILQRKRAELPAESSFLSKTPRRSTLLALEARTEKPILDCVRLCS